MPHTSIPTHGGVPLLQSFLKKRLGKHTTPSGRDSVCAQPEHNTQQSVGQIINARCARGVGETDRLEAVSPSYLYLVSCDSGPISSPVTVAPAAAPSGLGGRGGAGDSGQRPKARCGLFSTGFVDRRASSKTGGAVVQ